MTKLCAAELRETYREAEASLRLSGLDPSGDPFYESVKARVIAGELTLDAAAAEIDQQHLDAVIESGGTTEEAARLAELRAEGGWGADEDGTLTRYDSKGDVVEVIEPPVKPHRA